MFPASRNHRPDTPCRSVHSALTTDSDFGEQSVDHDSIPSLFQSTSLKQKAGQKLRPTLRKFQKFSSAANSIETREQNESNRTFNQTSKESGIDLRVMYESSSSSSSLCSSGSSSYGSSFEEEIDEDENDESKEINCKLVQQKNNDSTSNGILHTSCRINPREEERSDCTETSLNVKNEFMEFQTDENTFYDCNSPGRMKEDNQEKYHDYNEQSSDVDDEISFSQSKMITDNVKVDGNKKKNECSKLEDSFSTFQLDSEEKSGLSAVTFKKGDQIKILDHKKMDYQKQNYEETACHINEKQKKVQKLNIFSTDPDELQNNQFVLEESQEYIEKLKNLCQIYREEHQAARFMIGTLTLEKKDLESKLNDFIDKFMKKQKHFESVYTEVSNLQLFLMNFAHLNDMITFTSINVFVNIESFFTFAFFERI